MKRAREFKGEMSIDPSPKRVNYSQVESDEWAVTFQITKITSFLKVFELVKKLVNECKLSFSEENGMTILEGDTNQIALMNVVLRPNYFSNYQCKSRVNFGVSLHIFYEALKSMYQSNSGDSIAVKINEFVMELKSENKSFGEISDFRILAIEKPDIDQLTPGNNEYPFYAAIPAKRLVHVCQTLKNMNSDRITFETEGNGCYNISGHSDLVERYRCKLMTDQGMMLGVETKEEARLSVTIPLFYVQTVAQAHKLNERVEICIGPNLPFVLRYKIFDGVKKDEASTFTVWIATCLDPEH